MSKISAERSTADDAGVLDLIEVRRAAADVESAQHELRRRIKIAHERGATPTELASWAQVTRQTIYRWVADDTPTRRVPDAAAIGAALDLMASLVEDPYVAEQIRKRTRGTDEQQLLALRMGRQSISQETWSALTDDERATLALASEAESHLRRKAAAPAGGVLPSGYPRASGGITPPTPRMRG